MEVAVRKKLRRIFTIMGTTALIFTITACGNRMDAMQPDSSYVADFFDIPDSVTGIERILLKDDMAYMCCLEEDGTSYLAAMNIDDGKFLKQNLELDASVSLLDFGFAPDNSIWAVCLEQAGVYSLRGKTTLLRMVAGLESVSSGEVIMAGRIVNQVPPKNRDIAMVFQNYALYPNMKVKDNIAFPLKMQHIDRQEREGRVAEVAQKLELDALLDRKPGALSGGQRQRVALARAMIRKPGLFLMDEPLANLDAKLRTEMRREIIRLQRELGVTTIYVTHDQTEAMTMGTRIAVINGGVLQQFGTPQEIYRNPANLFVAGFIG